MNKLVVIVVIRGCLFKPVWSVWSWRKSRSSLFCLSNYLTQWTRLESRALIFCTLHFHINPLEYLSRNFAGIIKALADPHSQFEEMGDQERAARLRRTVKTHLRHLTFGAGNSPMSRLSSTSVCPLMRPLSWVRIEEGPSVACLAPCSSSVAF